MFRVKPQAISDILDRVMRSEGLETPLLQKRIIDAWDEVAGEFVAKQTTNKFIKNQTLFVGITGPALRSDLSMRRAELIEKLNKRAGAFVISDLRLY
ncbi:MAG: DUF721 domain-containing protein [Prevotella sp.]|nr:DUF721 domain-containing protein [Prevotella sp.]